jgi:hypothetical protein
MTRVMFDDALYVPVRALAPGDVVAVPSSEGLGMSATVVSVKYLGLGQYRIDAAEVPVLDGSRVDGGLVLDSGDRFPLRSMSKSGEGVWSSTTYVVQLDDPRLPELMRKVRERRLLNEAKKAVGWWMSARGEGDPVPVIKALARLLPRDTADAIWEILHAAQKSSVDAGSTADERNPTE